MEMEMVSQLIKKSSPPNKQYPNDLSLSNLWELRTKGRHRKNTNAD